MPINSQLAEEFEPRQAPKASSFYKAVPEPTVPDISLVFDTSDKSVVEVVPRSDSRPQAVFCEKMKNYEDIEPRTSKPIPVAPLPNESYAAWRARAMKSQLEKSSVLSNNTPPCDNFEVQRDIPESVEGSYSRYGANSPKLSRRENNRQLNRAAASRDTPNFSTGVNNAKTSSEHQSVNIRSFERSGSNHVYSSGGASINHRGHLKYYPCKPMHSHENNDFRREDSRNSSVETTYEEESFLENERKSSSINAKSKKMQEGRNHSGSGEPHSNFSNPRESPKKEKADKRDSLRDIYRIIQLQNEQIQSLQSQVEKLLRKSIDDSKRNDSPKTLKKDIGIQCEEERPQTRSSNVSVGVMTSFVDLGTDSQICKDVEIEEFQPPQCQCKNCPTASSSVEKNEKLPKLRKSRGTSQSSTQGTVSNNLHVIEENETDGSFDDSESVECATPTNFNAHRKNFRCQKSKRNDAKISDTTDPDSKISPKLREDICPSPKLVANLIANRQKDPANPTRKRHPPKHEELRKEPCRLLNYQSPRVRSSEDDVTLTLHGVELPTVTDPQISPEPSIHVDMQDFKEFSDEEDDTSTDEGSYSSGNESTGSNVKDNPNERESYENSSSGKDNPNGDSQGSWTFYDNVLGQVNKLLKNQNGKPSPNELPNAGPISEEMCNQYQNAWNQPGNALPTMEAVREATIQHLRQLGIDIPYNNGYNPPLPHSSVQNAAQVPRIGPVDHYGLAGRHLRERPPSETSLRMNALAMKYLSDEELASFEHLGLRRDGFQPEPTQFTEQQVPRLGRGVIGEVSSADFTLYGMNGTNLSFTTLRYLQRYQLTPGSGNNPQGIWRNQPQYGNFNDATNSNGVNYARTSPNVREGFLPLPKENQEMNPTFTNREPLSRNTPPNVQRDVQWAKDSANHCGSQKTKDIDMQTTTKTKRIRSKNQIDHLAKTRGKGRTSKGHPSPHHLQNVEKMVEAYGDMRDTRTHSSNILDIEALRQQRKLL